MRASGGPDLYQPMTPFVECWIGDADITRSRDGKPKTVISFSYSQYKNGAGQFQLDLYDPEWTAIEGQILSRSLREDGDVLTPIYFRFGYLGADGIVMAAPRNIEGAAFMGLITQYTTQFSNWGMNLSITGNFMGHDAGKTLSAKSRKVWTSTIPEIVNVIAARNNWVWEGFADGKEPLETPVTGQHEDTTEAHPQRFVQKEGESDFDFLNRIIRADGVRPADARYNNYDMLLIPIAIPPAGSTSIEEPPEEPLVYLFIEPQDMQKEPTRTYIVNRDPDSDVIRWSPSLDGIPHITRGGAGIVIRLTDSRLRQGEHLMYSEETGYFKYLKRNTPPTSPGGDDIELGTEQNNSTRTPPNTGDVYEGTRAGKEQLRTKTTMDIDSPYKVLPSMFNDRTLADRQGVTHWLDLFAKYSIGGDLEIIGDPHVQIEDLVDVYVIVNDVDGSPALHYSTNRYLILGITHSIQGGSYTTVLTLGTPGGMGENTTGEDTNAPFAKKEEPA